VGIIAVDPTSPFTGGAFLGDRVRMMGLALDAGVFIRSMGSRGNLGGLAATTSDAINILDAMGKDFIIVETVGSGQSEVDIIKYAHTVLVITVPGAGDQIQTLKAGILEIADILVVNKADKEGADQVMLELETMLDLNPRRCHLEWVPPVVKTSTTEQEGLKDLYEAIMKHRRFLVSSGRFEEKQKTRRHNEFIEHVMNRLREEMQRRLAEGAQFNEILEQVINRETDLHAAAEYVINALRL
jgi:LAO/AO transport system kinase